MSEKIKVWVATKPNGHPLVSTVAKDKRDCKNFARDLSVKGTRARAPEWIELHIQGWTVQPYTLTKGHSND